MMTNPNKPNIPGMEAMTDSLEFVKSLWANMGVPGMGGTGTGAAAPGMPGMSMPGMVMPTMSVEEIRKKITDLKAVESWLNLNMGMLRGTIQALEVQAATLTTLQAMSDTFAAGMNSFGASAQGGNGAASGNGKARSAQPDAPAGGQGDGSLLAASLVNTAAWWNMLQEQFGQAVTNAMAAAGTPAGQEQAPQASAEPDGKGAGAAGTATGAGRRKNGKPAE